MLTGAWSRADFRPVTYGDEAGRFEVPPLGWILHVVVGNGSPYRLFERAPAGSRRFSHLWVAKDGRAEQFRRFEGKSWAQSTGNATYWSVETEGFPTEPLTDDQLDTLAAWHVLSDTRDAVVDRVGDRGIGTHQMGGRAWGNHACPGALRAAQRDEILVRAQILRGLPPVAPAGAPPFPLPRAQFYAMPSRSTHSGFSSTVDRGHVRTWQSRMRDRGWTIGVDGLFGVESDRVLRQFQREKGLTVDGLLGPVSWGAAWIMPVT